MSHKYLCGIVACLIVLSSIPLTYAELSTSNNIIYVSTQGNDNNTGLTPETPKKTIQNAVNTAKSGETIHIKAGTYKETLNINKNVQLIGEGSEQTILNADYKGTCININPENKVLIEGIAITKGYGWCRGGGIYNDRSTVTVKNCIISSSRISWEYTPFNPAGGGIYNYYGDMVIEESTIQQNEVADEGGGISSIHSKLTIKNSIIQNNYATHYGSGGGIAIWYGNLTMENTIIRNNLARFGGGLFLEKTHATFKNCIIQNNTAQQLRGGIYISYHSRVNVDDSTKKQCVNNSAPNQPNGYWD